MMALFGELRDHELELRRLNKEEDQGRKKSLKKMKILMMMKI